MNPFRWKGNDPRWLLVFGPFLLLVVGLLVYLIAFAQVAVEKPLSWTREKALFVCDAPDWVEGNVPAAVEFVKPWVKYSRVVVVDDCTELGVKECVYEGDKGTRNTFCMEGSVLVLPADSKFDRGTMDEGGHGDETFRAFDKISGNLSHATIQFPATLDEVKPLKVDEASQEFVDLKWPANAEFLVVVHALFHAEGYDHAITKLFGPFVSDPPGHVLGRTIPKLGTQTTGL